MSLIRLSVTSKNGDTAYAGTVLFNSKFIERARTLNSATDTTVFQVAELPASHEANKYIVSDGLSTVVGVYDAYASGKATSAQETFAIVTFRDDVNDNTSSTTNKVIDLDDILKGIALPSDVTHSLLWISESDRRVRKVLVDKFLKAFEDLATTGTTTTYE